MHDLLHLSDRVSTLTDNLGEVTPLRADPIADSLKAVSSVTDWSAQKWDPLAMGLQAGLAERSKAQPQDNPIASLGTVEVCSIHFPDSAPPSHLYMFIRLLAPHSLFDHALHGDKTVLRMLQSGRRPRAVSAPYQRCTSMQATKAVNVSIMRRNTAPSNAHPSMIHCLAC